MICFDLPNCREAASSFITIKLAESKKELLEYDLILRSNVKAHNVTAHIIVHIWQCGRLVVESAGTAVESIEYPQTNGI